MSLLKKFVVTAAICIAYCSLSYGESCTSPQVKSTVYSTSETQMSTDTVVVVDFTLECKNSPKNLNIYAEFNGKSVPATSAVDGGKYQVSFTTEHKKLPSGNYKVRFFDDDLFSELRKAQRNGEDTSAVKTLFSVDFYHQAASQGLWVQTEHIAAAVTALVCYLAYSARSQLQS